MVNCLLLMQILLCIYFLQILDFLVTYIPRTENNTFFNLSTGTDLAINFDLVECITYIMYIFFDKSLPIIGQFDLGLFASCHKKEKKLTTVL